MDYLEIIKEVGDIIWVKHYDKTTEMWEEGILCNLINKERNLWKVYFPSHF